MGIVMIQESCQRHRMSPDGRWCGKPPVRCIAWDCQFYQHITTKRKENIMNLNEFAKKITLKEGKKKSVSIAQVKEIIRIIFTELAGMDEAEALAAVRRYRGKKK